MASTRTEIPWSVSTWTPTLCDVFVSFRGIDTQINFTNHLYDALNRNGIRTFMDDAELHNGQGISSTLLATIQNSVTCIIVVSENYASSSRCLDELVEIIERFISMGRLVVPVFYNIEPSVVRYQTGSFNEIFQKHEEASFVGDMEKLNKWRLSLKQLTNFSGHHVGENRYEADIINEVVDVVLREITNYNVGINSGAADRIASLSSGTGDVHVISIAGMGGMGKTTLAQCLSVSISIESLTRLYMREKINRRIRKRETFGVFGPQIFVLKLLGQIYFDGCCSSFTANVTDILLEWE